MYVPVTEPLGESHVPILNYSCACCCAIQPGFKARLAAVSAGLRAAGTLALGESGKYSFL